eukprot:Polyplicarium_translucidae@DN557_c0_g1_i1.p2
MKNSPVQAVAAIDQGTQATKCTVYDTANLRHLAEVSLPHRQIFPQAGWVEHDAAEILRNARTALEEASVASGAVVRAIGIANQRETVVAWDKNTGEPLTNAIGWPSQTLHDRYNDP